MRLIDMSVLKEWIENWFTKNRLYHPYAKNNNIPITELYDILEQMPSAHENLQPTCNQLATDCISRQAAIDAFEKELSHGDREFAVSIVGAKRILEGVPSAWSERKIGKWIQKEDPYGFFDTIPVCSECGHTTKMRETYYFCPNCGARMEN